MIFQDSKFVLWLISNKQASFDITESHGEDAYLEKNS